MSYDTHICTPSHTHKFTRACARAYTQNFERAFCTDMSRCTSRHTHTQTHTHVSRCIHVHRHTSTHRLRPEGEITENTDTHTHTQAHTWTHAHAHIHHDALALASLHIPKNIQKKHSHWRKRGGPGFGTVTVKGEWLNAYTMASTGGTMLTAYRKNPGLWIR